MSKWISYNGDSQIIINRIVANNTGVRFNYPCSSFTQCSHIIIQLKRGLYRMKLCGARGGNLKGLREFQGVGGKGGCAEGVIRFSTNQTVYLFVGGRGGDLKNEYAVQPGGFNGGGWTNNGACSGGGSTDVRLDISSLGSRIIVAGGGGGSNDNTNGGNGGGFSGKAGATGKEGPGERGLGGGQTKPTDSGTLIGLFGKGGSQESNQQFKSEGGAGGGGYFGGNRAVGSFSSGGGGSGYISGLDGCLGIKNQEIIESSGESLHYSGLKFINGSFGINVEADDGYAEIVHLINLGYDGTKRRFYQKKLLMVVLFGVS